MKKTNNSSHSVKKCEEIGLGICFYEIIEVDYYKR